MKILVTGATGFVGNHVIEYLLDKKHNVIATARNVEKIEHFEWFPSVQYLPFDINSAYDKSALFDYFGQPDKLIHLAWEGLPNFNSPIHIESNLMNQYRFLKSYLDAGGKHLLVTGTCFEYGLQDGCLSEDVLPNPITAYGIAKDSLRKFLQLLHSQQNPFIFQWVRLFYIYGQGQQATSIIPQLEAAIERKDAVFNMSGGEQTRDYLPVSKVAEYICRIALQEDITGVINCCSNEPLSVKRLVEDYIKLHSASIQMNLGHYPYTKYEPMHFWGDNTRLKSIKK
jgi:dTDP-6-deoxy-L-talose 4-dehydrogenase (NAD+)